MHALNRSKSRAAEAGFTLAEILVACAIISVGLVAVATGFGLGVDGVEAGRQQSTAVFLAEQRIEQAKDLAMRQTGLVQLVVGTSLPATEAYGTISGRSAQLPSDHDDHHQSRRHARQARGRRRLLPPGDRARRAHDGAVRCRCPSSWQIDEARGHHEQSARLHPGRDAGGLRHRGSRDGEPAGSHDAGSAGVLVRDDPGGRPADGARGPRAHGQGDPRGGLRAAARRDRPYRVPERARTIRSTPPAFPATSSCRSPSPSRDLAHAPVQLGRLDVRGPVLAHQRPAPWSPIR